MSFSSSSLFRMAPPLPVTITKLVVCLSTRCISSFAVKVSPFAAASASLRRAAFTYRMSVSYILHEIAQMERNDLRVERVSVRLPGGSCGGKLHWLAARDALDSPVIGGLVTVACA